jgi:hypothetical protein
VRSWIGLADRRAGRQTRARELDRQQHFLIEE